MSSCVRVRVSPTLFPPMEEANAVAPSKGARPSLSTYDGICGLHKHITLTLTLNITCVNW